MRMEERCSTSEARNRLAALLETLEDRMDLKEVHEALNEKDNRVFVPSWFRLTSIASTPSSPRSTESVPTASPAGRPSSPRQS